MYNVKKLVNYIVKHYQIVFGINQNNNVLKYFKIIIVNNIHKMNVMKIQMIVIMKKYHVIGILVHNYVYGSIQLIVHKELKVHVIVELILVLPNYVILI